VAGKRLTTNDDIQAWVDELVSAPAAQAAVTIDPHHGRAGQDRLQRRSQGCRAIYGLYVRIVPDKGWTRGTVWLTPQPPGRVAKSAVMRLTLSEPPVVRALTKRCDAVEKALASGLA